MNRQLGPSAPRVLASRRLFPQHPPSSMRSITRRACASGACQPHPTASVPRCWRRKLRRIDMSEVAIPLAPAADKIRCDACPVLCYIKNGNTGACDRYANIDGQLVRVDPHVLLERTIKGGGQVVPFHGREKDWDGRVVESTGTFVTAIGSGTTYPDYKPAPFSVAADVDGVDTVTVVTEGIFSYCGVKVKIDTDRHLGPETAAVRVSGEQVGHVTTAEYG